MSPFLSLARRSADPSWSRAAQPLQPVSAPTPCRGLSVFAFTVRAVSEPETVPRIISPFSKRGIVPRRFSVRREANPAWLTVWAEVDMPDVGAADIIAGNLRSILGVDAVLLEEVRQRPRKFARSFGAFAAG